MPEEPISRKSHRAICIVIIVCVVVLVAAFAWSYSRPPAGFKPNTVVHVKENAVLSQVGNELLGEHIIQSPLMFRIIVTILNDLNRKNSAGVGAGDYFFKSPENAWQVAYRLVHDEQDLSPVKVTLPEGITVLDMGAIIGTDINTNFSSSSMSNTAPNFIFDRKEFLTLSSTSEGYLFPDTYFFLPNVTPSAIISTLRNTFNEKVATLTPDIIAFQALATPKSYPRTLVNIVTMASILEREATSITDRRIIAGILWKRLDAGVPLQVDAPFFYILGTTSTELTVTDLATTSPYNTYVHKGMPPTPIDNPGLDAMTDAVTPTATNYWYYVSDKMGAIHYAVTYAEQEANTGKYVK